MGSINELKIAQNSSDTATLKPLIAQKVEYKKSTGNKVQQGKNINCFR